MTDEPNETVEPEAASAGTPYAEAVDAPPEVEVPAGGEVFRPSFEVEQAEVAANPEKEFVKIVHPDLPAATPADVTVGAYRETWAEQGWREVVGQNEDGSFVLAAPYTPDEEQQKVDPEGDGTTGTTGEVEDAAVVDDPPEASAGTESEPGSRKRTR